MTKTNNYNLKKPEPTDPLRLEDFNENADLIDAALGGKANAADLTALSQTVSALVQGGVGRAAWGSYTGDGTYGKSAPTVLDVRFTPVFAVISSNDFLEEAHCPTILCRDQSSGIPICGLYEDSDDPMLHVTWGDDSVSFYSTVSSMYQNNRKTNHYCWAVIGFSE